MDKKSDEYIRQLKQEGKTIMEIAVATDYSMPTIALRLKKMGMCRKQNGWTEEEKHKLISMRAKETPWADISDFFGRSVGACQNKYVRETGRKGRETFDEVLPPDDITQTFERGDTVTDEDGWTLRYLYRQGRHHIFRAKSGWIETFTDAQLLGVI